MSRFKKGIIVSNILDPLSKDPKDLKEVYQRLFTEKRYEAIETRVLKDESLIEYYNEIKKPNVSLEAYVTGDLSRMGVSLSSVNEESRHKAIEYTKEMLDLGNLVDLDYLGIASGKADSPNTLWGLDMFVSSLCELFEYVLKKGYKTKLAIEPLDQYAHKCNVIGSLDLTLRMVRRLEALGYDHHNYIITFDSAHVALNEDDFEETITKLAPYIYKIHFANAVLDKNDPLYGDNHMAFEGGFMNEEVAVAILKQAKKYIDHDVEVSLEIREKDKDKAWDLENYAYDFLNKVLKEVE